MIFRIGAYGIQWCGPLRNAEEQELASTLSLSSQWGRRQRDVKDFWGGFLSDFWGDFWGDSYCDLWGDIEAIYQAIFGHISNIF